MYSQLSFRYPFRKYQRLILAQVESGQGDHKYHIAAPPGSGKTIVGLELVRRFGFPAVIFAPTTTIQMQWREKAGMFTGSEHLETLTSLDPQRLAPINIFTYQLISTTGESQQHVQEMAVQRWIDELLLDGLAADDAAAQARLALLQQNNPASYRKELARRYLRIKRDLLRREDVDIASFLHPNATALIQRLIDYGIRTVVLDECHHLLDYWAIVLRHLIRQIEDPRVIGLTATLPSPEDDVAYENYTSLLGDVDFEVPTPAVVKEGDLAPYRDLVFFVQPSRREVAYLKNIQDAFETAISELTESAVFRRWVVLTILERQADHAAESLPHKAETWEEYMHRRPLLSLAGVRFLRNIRHPLPADLLLPVEAEEAMTLDDWAVLLERFGLDYLAISPQTEDHRLLARLRQILLPFGFTLTERGLRQSRSPGDLILTFSESKDKGVAEIILAENQALGERLRVVVVTDFERMSSGVRRLDGVLDRDAGSAVRLFHYLAAHPGIDPLLPILVTGRSLMVDASHGKELLEHFNAYLKQQNLQAACRFKQTANVDVMEVLGEGKDWGSRSYVGMVTDAFEQGLTRCLVGTRGIFGEGWDSLGLNTLIDLTSVTTSTSVQQLRGRSIRKDPNWPRKVAHNWDVVCVAPKFEKGDTDLRRFLERHQRYWGIVPLTRLEQGQMDVQAMLGGFYTTPQAGLNPNSLGTEMRGQIVKGICHVSPKLGYDLAVRGLKWTDFGAYNLAMLPEVRHRDQTYKLWGIGDEYSNFSYSATTVDGRDLKIRTVYSIQETLKAMLRAFRASLLGAISLAIWIALQTVGDGVGLEVCLVVGMIGVLIAFLVNLRSAYRLGRKFLVEQPPDAILLDVGRALLASLKGAGQVSRSLQPDFVRVVEQGDQSYTVLLDYASPEDAATFIRAYRQVFEPVRDQRYLILRDDNRLPNLALAPFWFFVRNWFRDTAGYDPAYHPVPDVLATRKELAEEFARNWERYVGGGKLVFTRNETGRRILLHARSQQRPKVKGLAFEIWR